MQEVRLALRALRATPIVSLVAVLSLALGIGANTAIFSLVNGLILRTLPVAGPQRLVTVSSDYALRHGFKNGVGWKYAMWERFRPLAYDPNGGPETAGPAVDARTDDVARHHSAATAAATAAADRPFERAFAWWWADLDLAESGEMQRAKGVLASGDFFATLGVPALLGRTFTPADDVRGGGRDGAVAVISYALWQRRFGGAADVVGRRLLVNRVPVTIVGVTPSEFFGIEIGESFDVAIPFGAAPVIYGARNPLDSPGAIVLSVMLRLKPGQSMEAATAAMNALQPQILRDVESQAPRFLRDPYVLVAAGTGSSDKTRLRQRYEQPLLTMTIVVGLVLLIACANIANLLLARATSRRHELSVRLALGASRWRLARPLLVESLVLSCAGAAAGLLFARWGSRALVAQLSISGDPVFLNLALDWHVLAFTATAAMATALLFGTAPAFRAARVPPIDAMKEQGRSSSGDGRLGLSSGFVVAQVALSLVLVVAAGLFVRTFDRLTRLPLGFDGDRVVVVDVDSGRTRVDAAGRAAFHDRLVAAVAAVPGVARAAGGVSTPGGGGLGNQLTDASGRAATFMKVVPRNMVGPGWLAAYGIPLRAGRDVAAFDTATAPPVVLVNDAFVREHFAGRSPIGVTLPASFPSSLGNRTIVGVVGDVVYGSRRDGVPPTAYFPLAQSADLQPPGRTRIAISVRATDGSPMLLARSISAALTAIDGDLAFTFRPVRDTVHASLAQERIVALLSGFFGVLALLLAGLGLYGVTAYAVSRRRAEIGIRMALGADAAGVVSLVLGRVLLLVGTGVIAGTIASVWLSRFVATLLYGLEPRDPLTLIGAAMILVVVGAVAGGLPARRASRIDPAIVLRQS